MWVVIIVNTVVVALAALGGRLRSAAWLALSFAILFAFLAVRYNFGNDYPEYLGGFNELRGFEFPHHYEPGWQALCLAFKPLGFFSFVAALAALNCYAYYAFVRRYVPPMHYGFAVFLYVFNPYLMLVHASAMRQSLAISIFLYAIRYIESRSCIRYALCVVAAVLVHSTAIVLAPVYVFAWATPRVGRREAIAAALLFVVATLSAAELRPLVADAVSAYWPRYEIYTEPGEIATGLGVVYAGLVFGLLLVQACTKPHANGLLYRLAACAYFAAVPLSIANDTASRLGMYFAPVLIAVIPSAASAMRERMWGALFRASYVGITLYGFIAFFFSDVWRDGFAEYHTIWSALR